VERDVRVAAGCFPSFCSNSLALSTVALNFDPLDFLDRKFLARAIVEFWLAIRGSRWFGRLPRVQSYRRKDFHAGNSAKRQVWQFWDGKIT
jgi:hypothetical protein